MKRGMTTIYRDVSGWWRWSIKATNGQIIGASTEAYYGRRHAIENFRVITGRRIDTRGVRGAVITRPFRRR